MSLSTQPYKGARDFYPEDMRLQRYIFDVWRKVCESFGYEEYDTPLLEPLELYAAKTSDEIVNEQTYGFTDRGGRQVVMRPEMTPSVSRLVAARRQELGYPVRLYSIPNCFRYERPQRGRLREFWQLNADLFGVEGIEADIEAVALADAIMKAFGATDQYYITVGSRTLVQKLEALIDLSADKRAAFYRLVDGKNKMEPSEFDKRLSELLSGDTLALAKTFFTATTVDDLPSELAQSAEAQEVRALLTKLAQRGVTNTRFNPDVVRGFDYYTAIVFEVYDADPENNRSMFGGGRYDGLVGKFGVEPVPTVGFAMGDATLQNFLETHQLIPALKPVTDVAVLLVGDVVEAAQPVIQQLRKQGLNVSVDFSGRKPDKLIKAAEKRDTTKVVFIGEQELAEGTYRLKDLVSGEELRCSIEQLVSTLNERANR